MFNVHCATCCAVRSVKFVRRAQTPWFDLTNLTASDDSDGRGLRRRSKHRGSRLPNETGRVVAARIPASSVASSQCCEQAQLLCCAVSHKKKSLPSDAFMRDALSDDAAATPRSALPGRGARALTSSQPAPSGASGPPTTLLIITACAAISWCCSLHLRLQPD